MSIFSVQDHYPGRERTVAELYRQVIAQAELAETLGYDTFFVAEHHFHEYGVVPNPAVMLSTLAQRTQRLKLGTAISILTFHNPLTVAESYAMVDVLSGGRLVLGVGSGYLKHEFAGYAIEPAEKRDRFDENLVLVKRLLSGERVSFEGRYNRLDAVQLNVQPLQREIPVYVAVLRREAAYHVGLQGHDLMCVPYASLDRFDEIADLVGEFRRGRAASPRAASAENAAVVTLHTHVAESDAEARKLAADAFDLYVDTRLYAKKAVYDDIIASGLSLFGSVETVADKLVALHRAGVDHVSTLHNFGLLPEAHVHRSMRLLMEEVMPRVRDRIGAREAA
ncbi:MAG TPA: LLM class flavin-dependent oxidoreductase [Stellaceae bacterium]|jgi:alkanesulfonate monooxygenase SsuD/methylene tetrahydromethanopterin reductase-like flavin-dependent oxidoreductase (luciferase family)